MNKNSIKHLLKIGISKQYNELGTDLSLQKFYMSGTTIPAYNGKFPDQLMVALSSQFEKLYEANNIINDNLSEPTNITKILELLSPIIPQLNVNGIKLVIEGNEVKLT